jgi:ribosomal protein L37E
VSNMKADREAEAAMLASGIPPTHHCGMCGHKGFEHDIVGCLRCGWDEMIRIEQASAERAGGGK